MLKKVIYKKYDRNKGAPDGTGEYVNTYNYCLYLFGILIWHIKIINITDSEAQDIFQK